MRPLPLMALVLAVGAGCAPDVFIGGELAGGDLPGPVPRPPTSDPAGGTHEGDWRLSERGVVDLRLVEEITGDLIVDDPGLSELLLYDLALVEGDVRIEDAISLANINLSALVRVGGELSIADTPALTALSIPVLREAGALSLARSPSLTFLNLDELAALEGGLGIDGLDVLTVRLPALESVAGSVTVGGIAPAPSETQVLELPLLERVERDLQVVRAPALRALRLPALASIGGQLVVSENPALSSLEAPTLATVGAGGCLCENPALSSCVVVSLLAQLGPAEQEAVASFGNAEDDSCP